MPQEYVPLQPVFGPGVGKTESERPMKRYVRTFRVLQALSRLSFDSVLDVGGGEGYTSALVRQLFGATSVPLDARTETGAAARRFYGLDAVAADAQRLPIRAGSFDVVISTETIEHLTHPVEGALEMLRVASKAVLISTCEASPSPALAWIARKVTRYDLVFPGGHVNFFTGWDFRTLLGEATTLSNQFIKPGLSRRGTRAIRYEGQDVEQIKSGLRMLTWTPRYLPGSRGILALRVLDPAAVRAEPKFTDEELMDAVLSHKVDLELASAPAGSATSLAPRVPESLRNRLECPDCGAAAELEVLNSGCPSCGCSASVADGVPILKPRVGIIGGPIDRTRHAATVQRAGLRFASLDATKRRLELRRTVSPATRSLLRGARRLVRVWEGTRRLGYYLSARGASRSSRSRPLR